MTTDHLEHPLLLVIFGITGDLAQRKLLPALYQLAKSGDLPEQFHIIGVSRREVTTDDIFGSLKQTVNEEDYQDSVERRLREHTSMQQMDLLDVHAYDALLKDIETRQTALGEAASRLYYLSIPSQAFTPIVRLLGQTGHNAPLSGGKDAPRLLIEKPFGFDLASAKELIHVLDEHFGESQIYRIDHYVAKETVQNILVFRFQNPLFEGIWNNRHIESITILAHEKLDIEGRTNFYEQTGALRDLIQSHLLQLLAIITMDKPARLESNEIHAAKSKLMSEIIPIAPDKVADVTARGQYEGYRDEVASPDSLTETFAQLQLEIASPTWEGVAITLETGKALNEKRTEIEICFASHDNNASEQNQLIFRIQPTEGITLRLRTKRPGIHSATEIADMDLEYARSFVSRPAEAYERVIVDAIRGDQTLFATSEEVLHSWHIIENVLTQWSHNDNGLAVYPKGSAATDITEN